MGGGKRLRMGWSLARLQLSLPLPFALGNDRILRSVRWLRRGSGRQHERFPGEISQARQAHDVLVSVHVGPQRDDGVDVVFGFEPPDRWAIQQAAVQNQDLHHPPPERLHQAVDQGIEEGALMLVARDQACGHHQKEIQVAVDMHQRDDLVAPMPLVAFVAQIHGLGIDRMVMLVEQH